jgi:lantibiotic transport system permease protein
VTALSRALGAEAIKLRRTLALRMTVIAPLIVVLFQFLQMLDHGHAAPAGADAWPAYTRGTLALWSLFMLPLLIALETALLAGLEHGPGTWRNLFALPAPRWSVYAAKLVAALIAVLTATGVLVGGTLITGWGLSLLRPELGLDAPTAAAALVLARDAGAAFLAAWCILALQSWIALRWASTPLALGVGIAGTFIALFAAGSPHLRFYPWALPVQAYSGADAERALVLGLGGGMILAVLAVLDLSRRDVA